VRTPLHAGAEDGEHPCVAAGKGVRRHRGGPAGPDGGDVSAVHHGERLSVVLVEECDQSLVAGDTASVVAGED